MPTAGAMCQAWYGRSITETFAFDASLAWLGAAALISGSLAYVGAMVGLVLGQFRLPLLVAALGASAAVPTNLAISSIGAATGALGHAREGRVDVRLLISIGLPSAVAAYLSSRLLVRVDAWWIGVVIGSVLLVSAVPIARKARGRSLAGPPIRPPDPGVEAQRSPDLRLLSLEILIGVVLGGLSGVVGLLLGTLRLPAMLRLGVSPPRAAGTNMAIGFCTGVAGALGAVGDELLSVLAVGLVGSATLLGAWLGARQTKRLATARHFALIATVLVVVGLWMIGKSLLEVATTGS